MIARLLAAAARSLFTVAVLLGLAAVLAGYGAYRLLRAATIGAPARPKQAAAFALLLALVELVRALGASLPDAYRQPPPAAVDLERTEAP